MKKQLTFTLALATLLAYGAQASQEQLAASIKQAREEATGTSAQLKKTLEALNALVKQTKGDLAPAFQAFKAEIPNTEATARATKARVDMMNTERSKYFTDWQSTVATISNPSLQKKAQKRLDSASASYDKVHEAMTTAAEKFKPFLSDLSDVEKALSQDVTAGGVKAMKGTTRKANWDYQYVSKAIDQALKDMGKMEKALSAEAN